MEFSGHVLSLLFGMLALCMVILMITIIVALGFKVIFLIIGLGVAYGLGRIILAQLIKRDWL